MKVLITGGQGQLGGALASTFARAHDVVAPPRSQLDLSDPAQIVERVREIKPDLIVNAGAYTAVDLAETEVDAATAINALAPAVLAEEANRLGVPLIHYSTDYVFSGMANIPYVETDATGPLNMYGRTKLAGELAVRETAKQHAVLRVSWLYGNHRQNFMLTMLRLARERDQLSVVNDQFGSPTWVQHVAEITKCVVATDVQHLRLAIDSGVYHLAASGQTSWHEFAATILAQTHDAQRRVTQISAIATAEFKAAAKRPSYSVLNCAKIEQALDVKMAPWPEQLRECLTVRESSMLF